MGRTSPGELEQLLLLAVLQLGDEAYGTAIMREMEERGGRSVSPGSLFAAVDRLEAKGLVTSRLGDANPGRGGKRKRFLTVTPEGLSALRDARDAWVRMAEGLGEALQG